MLELAFDVGLFVLVLLLAQQPVMIHGEITEQVKMGYHPSSARNAKRYRERNKKLGLCTVCGDKAVEGKKMCKDHADKVNKYQRDKRNGPKTKTCNKE